MDSSEASLTSTLVRSVIAPLDYYSDAAKAAEIAKYSAEALAALLSEDPYSILVAKVEDDVIAFCISRYDDGVIWLAWFGVHEKFRGTRVASDILEQLEDATRARNCSKIWCDTRTENTRSQRVLERTGYSRICTITQHWYGQDFHLWEKRLETRP
jgi:RimJ/RimL family protein N-acetyltransferase